MGLNDSCSFLGSVANVANIGAVSELIFVEQGSTPAPPPIGQTKIYIKDDGNVYVQDSTGKETMLEVPLNTLDTKLIDASTIVQNVWLEVIASTSGLTRKVQVFDTAGLTIEWGTGAAASEVTRFLSGAGTNETTEVEIAAGSRLSIRVTDAGPYSGTILTNLFG